MNFHISYWKDLSRTHAVDTATDQWRRRPTACQCKRRTFWTQLIIVKTAYLAHRLILAGDDW